MHTALRFAPRSLGVHSKFTCGTGKAVASRWYATTPTGVQPDTAETNGGLDALKRSYLYGELLQWIRCIRTEALEVPSSNVRMLEKSLSTPSDVIIYDLEDSVPPSLEHKKNARSRLTDFLSVRAPCFMLRKTFLIDASIRLSPVIICPNREG